MCWDATMQFPRDARSPGEARRFCTARLSSVLASGPERDKLIDDAALIVSELVTNAINARCHTGVLDLSWHRHVLRIGVWDDMPGQPEIRAATHEESHGRGLAITAFLSTAWGIEPTDPGKRVWAELAVPSGLTHTLSCER